MGEDGNAKRSFLPRLVSYFEATILASEEEDSPTEVSVDEVLKQLEQTASDLDAATEEVLKEANTFDTNPNDTTEKTTVDEACLAIGIVSEHHRTDILPGWGKGNGRNPCKSGNGVLSYGLHSDDGSAWANRAQLKGFATIRSGDTVGCGIDYRTHTVFYTLNGQFVGLAHALPSDGTAHTCDFYPALGVDSPDAVECNFGLHQPFQFDLVECCRNEPPAFETPTPTKVWKSPQDLKEDAARELRAKQMKALQAKKSKRRFSLKRMFSRKKNKSMKVQ